MGWIDEIKEADIDSPEKFARYLNRRTGTPFDAKDFKSLGQFKRQLRIFFEQNPEMDYQALCRVVQWSLDRKRRFARIHSVLAVVEFAKEDGYLDNYKPEDRFLAEELRGALEVEKDIDWRLRLSGAEGIEARREVYEEWTIQRAS